MLAPVAATIIMKVFYAARVARYDLLRAVAWLARYITKWTPEMDRRLARLMNYVKSSLKYRQIGWVGDPATELNLDLYADANYGTNGGKSTSGMQLHVEGPNTCFPISGNSSSQTAVSHSTPEAEIVAAAAALRKTGIPSMIVWAILKGDRTSTNARPGLVPGAAAAVAVRPTNSTPISRGAQKAQAKRERKERQQLEQQERLLREPADQRKAKLYFHEDNEAMIQVCRHGRNPTMRHIGRVHGISVSFLHQEFGRSDTHLGHFGLQSHGCGHPHEGLLRREGRRVGERQAQRLRLEAR